MATDPEVLTVATLLEERAALRRTVDDLLGVCRRQAEEITVLQDRVATLEKEVVEARRESKRQAAPFRRSERKPASQHKKPGRKDGHDPAWRRPPETVDETIDVPPHDGCPDCGGPLCDPESHERYVTDIPPVRPVTKRFVTHSGYCKKCKQRVHSRHPDLPTDAVGAAGTVLGHGVVALAAQMWIQFGASFGKLFSSERPSASCPSSSVSG